MPSELAYGPVLRIPVQSAKQTLVSMEIPPRVGATRMISEFARRSSSYLIPFAVSVTSAAAYAGPIAQDLAVPAEPIVRPVGTAEVHVSEFMMVDILSQRAYLTDILQKLAIQARRNIVPSGTAERVVTANINGVPFYDALTGLLEPNGLGYIERGEFIFVYSREELEAMDVGGFGAITKVISLDYIRSADARDYVLTMLSPKGSIEVTRDIVDKENTAGAGQNVSAGAGSVTDSTIYTPAKDEYDLRNAIIVHDRPDRIKNIARFLKEVDVRPAQILLEASIIQTALTEDTAFGVDFALLGDSNFVDFFQAPVGGQTLDFLTDPVSGLPVVPATTSSFDTFVQSTPGNTGVGEATVRAGFVGDIGVFLRALDQITDVTLLSNPKIMTLNRQRSKVFVGTKIGFFETTTVENQVLQSLKTIDTGIVLDIRPFILSDGRIRLELAPKISKVTFRDVAAPGGGIQEIPDEDVQSVTTDILIPEGNTAVIGGLFREDTTRKRSQVPILGDLPWVGPLFQGRDDKIEQTEIIFLITPSILDDNALGLAGAEAGEMLEDVRVGSRIGLLPWSRERQSARLNLEAEALLIRGDAEGARWKLRRSLGMNPQQSDVIRAIELLESRDLWIRNLSLVNRLVDEEVARRANETSSSAE